LDSVSVVILDECDRVLVPMPRSQTLAMQNNRLQHPKPGADVLDRLFFGPTFVQKLEALRKSFQIGKPRRRTAVITENENENEKENYNPKKSNPEALDDFRFIERQMRHKTKTRKVQLICSNAKINARVKGEIVQKRWLPASTASTTSDSPKLISINATPPLSIPSLIKHQLVELEGKEKDPSPEREEASALAAVVHIFRNRSLKNALLFIPDSQRFDWAVLTLAKLGIKAKSLHENVHESLETRRRFLEKLNGGEIELALLNENTSRGLDFPELHNVFITAPVLSVSSYLHMAGRIARASSSTAEENSVIVVGLYGKTGKLKSIEQALNISFSPISL